MMSPSFVGPAQQVLDLTDAALRGADPCVVVDHLGGDVLGLAALLLHLAEPGEARPSPRRSSAVGTRRVSVESTIRPRSSLSVCSSATVPPHDATSRITSARALRDRLRRCRVIWPVEMTARVIGAVAATCLATAPLGRGADAAGLVAGRLLVGVRWPRSLPPPASLPARPSSSAVAGGDGEHQRRGTGRGWPARPAASSCHGAVTRPTPDRFPRRAVPRFPGAPARVQPATPCASSSSAAASPGWPRRTGSARSCPDAEVAGARGVRPARRQPAHGRGRRGRRRRRRRGDAQPAARGGRPGPRGRPRRRPGPPGHHRGAACGTAAAGADAAHADGRPARPARARRGHLRARASPAPPWTPCCPPTELGDRDISVGDLVEERLGKEVVDRLVEPLLGGVYAGHAREISARAAVPQMVALLERDRSLTRAAAAATAADPATGDPVFAGIRGGVGRLPGALADASGAADAHRSHRARPGPAPGRRLEPRRRARPATPRSSRPTPSCWPPRPGRPPGCSATSRPPRRSTLARIEYASMAIVTLAFPARAFPEVAGSGFLVPPVDGRRSRRRRSPSPSGTGSARPEPAAGRRCW